MDRYLTNPCRHVVSRGGGDEKSQFFKPNQETPAMIAPKVEWYAHTPVGRDLCAACRIPYRIVGS